MNQTIRVTIDKQGNPTVAVEGCAGPACQQLTEALEQALGKPSTQKLTEEFYEVGEVSGRKESA